MIFCIQKIIIFVDLRPNLEILEVKKLKNINSLNKYVCDPIKNYFYNLSTQYYSSLPLITHKSFAFY